MQIRHNNSSWTTRMQNRLSQSCVEVHEKNHTCRSLQNSQSRAIHILFLRSATDVPKKMQTHGTFVAIFAFFASVNSPYGITSSDTSRQISPPINFEGGKCGCRPSAGNACSACEKSTEPAFDGWKFIVGKFSQCWNFLTGAWTIKRFPGLHRILKFSIIGQKFSLNARHTPPRFSSPFSSRNIFDKICISGRLGRRLGAQIDVTFLWRKLENFGFELVKFDRIWQNLTSSP